MTLKEINAKIEEINELRENKDTFISKRNELENVLDKQLVEDKKLAYKVTYLQKELETLEKGGVKRFISSVTGKLNNKISYAKTSIEKAKALYAEKHDEVESLQSELYKVTKQLGDLDGIDKEYKELIKIKTDLIIKTDPERKMQMDEYKSQINNSEFQLKEILQAIEYGEAANVLLSKAITQLYKALDTNEYDKSADSHYATNRKINAVELSEELIQLSRKQIALFEKECLDIEFNVKFTEIFNPEISRFITRMFNDRRGSNKFEKKVSSNLENVNNTKNELVVVLKELVALRKTHEELLQTNKKKLLDVVLNAK